MPIPVLFLESGSGHQAKVKDEVATATALTLVQTLITLRKANRSIAVNSSEHLSKIQLTPDKTLQSVLAGPEYRDQWLLIKTLASNSPLSYGVDEWLEVVGNCEAKTSGGIVSLALLWAVLCETGTVSLNVAPVWGNEWISTHYSSLDADANVQLTVESIPNISHPLHTATHKDWLSELNSGNTAASVWRERNARFPGLRFLSRIERQLAELSVAGAPYVQALETLKILNDDALLWGGAGNPNYSIKVASGEHDKRRDLADFFDESREKNRNFGRHAYFTGGIAGRIHFIADATEKKFVIGYIGKKLLD